MAAASRWWRRAVAPARHHQRRTYLCRHKVALLVATADRGFMARKIQGEYYVIGHYDCSGYTKIAPFLHALRVTHSNPCWAGYGPPPPILRHGGWHVALLRFPPFMHSGETPPPPRRLPMCTPVAPFLTKERGLTIKRK